MRSKKEIKNNHQKAKKITTTAEILEIDGGREKPEYDIHHLADDHGWYQKIILSASKSDQSLFVQSLRGKPLVTIEEFDGDVVLTRHKRNNKKEIKISLPYCDLWDIVTAFVLMERFYKKRTGRKSKNPQKLVNVKTRTKNVKRTKA